MVVVWPFGLIFGLALGRFDPSLYKLATDKFGSVESHITFGSSWGWNLKLRRGFNMDETDEVCQLLSIIG